MVVAVTAFLSYARYWRCGLTLTGEGGTIAVLAMRLLEGQRPMVDTFLGYNLMWFQPVVWLFQAVGPNYLALRAFFFVLCGLTGVMTFFVVRRVTGSGWYSVVAALGPVLIPGMMFRNYMGFVGVLNMLALLMAWVYPARSRPGLVLRTAFAGLALGLTFLIRIELGAFFLAITLGLAGLHPWGRPGSTRARIVDAAIGLAMTLAVACAAHVPFLIDARARGYERPFVDQYLGWVNMMGHFLSIETGNHEAAQEARRADIRKRAEAVGFPVEQAMQAVAEAERKGDSQMVNFLQKPSPLAVFGKTPDADRLFAAVLWLPIAAAGLIVMVSGAAFLCALRRGDDDLRAGSLALLVTTGSALTLFPQYFFFRPDTPHLSEFMVPFFAALACATWMMVRWARHGGVASVGWIVALGCVVNAGLYFAHALPAESAGTAAARLKRNHEFVGANGVRVKLKEREHREISELFRLITTHTKPDDWVVTYPYSPTVNFLTNRRSYEYNLYVDNAHNVVNFFPETRAEIEKFHPAAILIDNRAVNGTDASRFQNWAAETYAWIKANYVYAGTFRKQELYFRPDLLAAPARPATSDSTDS